MDGRMRQGQPGGGGKRNRGRGGRRPFNTRNQMLDSNGPSVRIRGNALQIYEKYQQLARDSSLSGDRVAAENLLQHAEHYYRIFSASNGIPPRPPQGGEGSPPSNGPPPEDGSLQVADGDGNGQDEPDDGPQPD